MKPNPNSAAVVERMVALAQKFAPKTPDASRERQFVASLEERIAGYDISRTRRRQFTGLALAAAARGRPTWLGRPSG